MTRALSVRAAIYIAVAAASCYSTPQPTCTFICGPGNDCPANYGCSTADNRCHLLGANGALMACELPDGPSLPDGPAAMIDAPVSMPDSPMSMADGPVDEPDSPPPPPIDAPVPTPDAPPDIDAPLPIPDAPPPDANVADATDVDA